MLPNVGLPARRLLSSYYDMPRTLEMRYVGGGIGNGTPYEDRREVITPSLHFMPEPQMDYHERKRSIRGYGV